MTISAQTDKWRCRVLLQSFFASAFLMAALPTSSLANPAKCSAKNSMAWCILDAAGYSDGASDVSLDRAEKFLEKLIPKVQEDSKGPDAGYLAIAGLEAAKLTSPILGSRGGSIGWALLGAFLDGGKAGERVQMFMVMPESAVVDGNPGKTAELIYVEALRRFLEAESAELVETTRKPTFGAIWTERNYRMKGGPRCGEDACMATARFFSTDSKKMLPKAIETDPQWVGSSTAYVWNRFYASAEPYVVLESDQKRNQMVGKKDYLKFIKFLPSWFFLYLPGEVNLLVNSERIFPLAK